MKDSIDITIWNSISYGMRTNADYLKEYDKVVANPRRSEPTAYQIASRWRKAEKISDTAKALRKDVIESLNSPFCFYVFVQLENIPTNIILYVLLHFSKSRRKALMEMLADLLVFLV